MSVYNYKILKQEGRAKRAEVTTIHGTIQTPVFMNVGTVAAIKDTGRIVEYLPFTCTSR